MIELFAAPVIDDTTWYSMLIGGFLIVTALLAVPLYFALKNKTKLNNTQLLISSIFPSMLIIGLIVLIFQLPTIQRDRQWEQDQKACGKDIGATDGTTFFDANSAQGNLQQAYRICLDLKASE